MAIVDRLESEARFADIIKGQWCSAWLGREVRYRYEVMMFEAGIRNFEAQAEAPVTSPNTK